MLGFHNGATPAKGKVCSLDKRTSESRILIVLDGAGKAHSPEPCQGKSLEQRAWQKHRGQAATECLRSKSKAAITFACQKCCKICAVQPQEKFSKIIFAQT